jgi:hypothetical protein
MFSMELGDKSNLSSGVCANETLEFLLEDPRTLAELLLRKNEVPAA